MKKRSKVVIIGSGIGGLICGAFLAKEGYEVTVLEKNKQIGGCLQIFVRDRHIFNSSVHYIGGLDHGQSLYKVFNYLGIMDDLEIEKMDEDAFDKIIFHNDDKQYSFAQGYPKFIKNLVADFPEEEDAIRKYAETMKRISEEFSIFNSQEENYEEKSSYLTLDAKTFISSLTKNERLRNVLAGNNILYAGVGEKTPFFIHALVLNSYIESSWVFINGTSQIAKLLSRIITDYGGTVKRNRDVKRLVEKDGLLRYAETAEGEKYTADQFISNIHPSNTLEITQTNLLRPVYKQRICSLENSVSIFTLNIVLKSKRFKYINSNYYCHVKDDVWKELDYTDETWPLSYGIFFTRSLKDPKYSEGVTIMAYMKYDEVEQWKDTCNTVRTPQERGNSYENFKKEKAEKLLQTVFVKFPDLKSAIHRYYTSTPLSYRDYMGTYDGSMYGILKDCNAPIQNMVSTRTRIKNLLLTGQNINLHGIHGVAMSSIICCGVLLGLPYVLNKIENAQNS
jgi:all-trans-retinol 13,14-reductase